MSKLDSIFAEKKPFIGYLCVGDGGYDYCLEAARALIAGGIDILELGLPFSDPVADGPVIQQATDRALAAGADLAMALKMAEALKKESSIPIILMTYANPILASNGCLHHAPNVDGVLLVDLPPEDPLKLRERLRHDNLLCPMLLSSNTPATRAEKIIHEATGFLYYVAQKGVTGVRSQGLPPAFKQDLGRFKAMTQKPIVAGFGIGSKQAAKEALEVADGFVVGSYFVRLMGQKVTPRELEAAARALDPREEA